MYDAYMCIVHSARHMHNAKLKKINNENARPAKKTKRMHVASNRRT